MHPGPTPRSPGRLRGALRRVRRAFLVLVVLLLFGAGALYVSTPDVTRLRTSNPTGTAYIDLRRRQAAEAGRSFDLRWTWVPLASLPDHVWQLVLLAEDWRFFSHGGIDLEAVGQVLRDSLGAGRVVAGASTVTQQLARNLYLSPDRSLVRKLREVAIAWRLEAALDKLRILELYLNVVEWGDGIFGVEAAARHWYGCASHDLTPAQAARLAVALPQPFRRSPAAPDPDLVRQAARLLARLCRLDRLTVAARDAAFVELGVTDETRPPPALLEEPPRQPGGPDPPSTAH